jgi:hypothetical protein
MQGGVEPSSLALLAREYAGWRREIFSFGGFPQFAEERTGCGSKKRFLVSDQSRSEPQ